MWKKSISEICLCGSWKKKEKCYWVLGIDNQCILFLEEKKAENIITIQNYIDLNTGEISSAVKLLCSNNKHIISQIALIFSYFETLVRLWTIYCGKRSDKNKKKNFKDRYEKFCCSDDNKYRNKWYHFPPLKIVYDIRSSITHSLAIKNKYNEYSIWLINGDWFTKEIKQIRQKMDKDINNKRIVISPSELFVLWLAGAKLMLDEINKGNVDSNKIHLIAINRLAVELQKESVTINHF